MHGDTDLAEVAQAAGLFGATESATHRWQEQGGQDHDDGDHDQHLDESKGSSTGPGPMIRVPPHGFR